MDNASGRKKAIPICRYFNLQKRRRTKAYRKATHTNQYINWRLCNANKTIVMSHESPPNLTISTNRQSNNNISSSPQSQANCLSCTRRRSTSLTKSIPYQTFFETSATPTSIDTTLTSSRQNLNRRSLRTRFATIPITTLKNSTPRFTRHSRINSTTNINSTTTTTNSQPICPNQVRRPLCRIRPKSDCSSTTIQRFFFLGLICK